MNNVILCMIDFSEASRDVLKYAVQSAKQVNGHIAVLYTYRFLAMQAEDPLETRKKIEEKARRQFALLEKEVLAGSGVPYDFKIEVGFVSNRVTEYTKTNGVNFLVMGNRMNASTRESFDELAEKVSVPLVIVP